MHDVLNVLSNIKFIFMSDGVHFFVINLWEWSEFPGLNPEGLYIYNYWSQTNELLVIDINLIQCTNDVIMVPYWIRYKIHWLIQLCIVTLNLQRKYIHANSLWNMLCRQFILNLYLCVYIHILEILFMLESASWVLCWLHSEV